MNPESSIEARFRRWVQARYGGLCMKLAGPRGWPDRVTILPNGRVVFMEFKTPDGRASVHQELWIERLRRLGHEAEIVFGFDHAVEIIEREP